MRLHPGTIPRPHGPMLKEYLVAARPQFLVASLLPVILGTVIGHQRIVEQGGSLDWLAFLLALVCILFVHLATNVINDVYDDVNGTDRINRHAITPFTGGSRAIQENVLTRQQMRQWGYLLVALAVASGILLMLYKGYMVLLFGLAGLFLGVTYSMPPVQLASRGLGELAIILGCGVIPVTGASWLQSGDFGIAPLLLSVSAGLWITNIIVVNEVPDAQADALSGKRTLAVRFGDKATAGMYLINNIVAVTCIGIAAFTSFVPFAALILPLLFLLPQVFVTDRIRRWQKDREAYTKAIKFNIASYVLNILWVTFWIVAA